MKLESETGLCQRSRPWMTSHQSWSISGSECLFILYKKEVMRIESFNALGHQKESKTLPENLNHGWASVFQTKRDVCGIPTASVFHRESIPLIPGGILIMYYKKRGFWCGTDIKSFSTWGPNLLEGQWATRRTNQGHCGSWLIVWMESSILPNPEGFTIIPRRSKRETGSKICRSSSTRIRWQMSPLGS